MKPKAHILFFLCTTSLLLCSCGKKNEKNGANTTIAPETVKEVVLDMAKAERMTYNMQVGKQERKEIMQQYKKSILSRHGISEEQYESYMRSCLQDPEKMKKLFGNKPTNK